MGGSLDGRQRGCAEAWMSGTAHRRPSATLQHVVGGKSEWMLQKGQYTARGQSGRPIWLAYLGRRNAGRHRAHQATSGPLGLPRQGLPWTCGDLPRAHWTSGVLRPAVRRAAGGKPKG
jgi:hypothetical protein